MPKCVFINLLLHVVKKKKLENDFPAILYKTYYSQLIHDSSSCSYYSCFYLTNSLHVFVYYYKVIWLGNIKLLK